jgi:WD40 repeat protein
MIPLSTIICVLIAANMNRDSGFACDGRPSPIDASVIAAWKKAGATFGWMNVDELGAMLFVPEGTPATPAGYLDAHPREANAASLPAFHYDLPRLGSMAGLPPPGVPFGLVVRSVPKDADLSGLASLKELRFLRLEEGFRREGVWKAGSLGKLAALEHLEAFDGDAMSGQLIKELIHLKQLKSLRLSLTNATAEAMDEIANLERLEALNLNFTSPYQRADSDGVLKELAQVWKGQSLRHLNLCLADTHLTEAGVKALAGFRQVRLTLNLSQNRLGSTAYKALARLEQLRSLSLDFSDVTDADLKEIAGLEQLEVLGLTQTQITDAGLRELARLRRLRTLNLAMTNVTDAGVKALAGAQALEGLVLASTKATGACLRDVATFKRMKWLSVPDRVTDADLKQLAGMNLVRLMIPSTAQTDVGLKNFLAAIHPPEELHLAYWNLTDAIMKELGRQKQLRVLDLSGQPVTNAGLEELAGLTKLQVLDLRRTQATEAGAANLKAKLPATQILVDQPPAPPDRIGASPLPGAIARRWRPDDSVRMLVFASDGKTLLSLGTESGQLWDVSGGKLLRSYDEFPPRTHGELPLIDPFAACPDGRWVALGPGLVEVATGKIRTLKGATPEELTNAAMSFSPDGRFMALGSVFGTIHVWDIATGKEQHRLRWRQMEHCAFAFSADAKLLAAGSRDRQIGLWEVAMGKRLYVLGHRQDFEPVHRLEFSRDGQVLVSSTPNGRACLWEIASGKQLAELPEHEIALVFSPRGRLLASCDVADHVIHLRNLATGQDSLLKGHAEEITMVAFAPDGKTLASASRDRTLRLWDVGTGKLRFIRTQQKDAIEAMAFSHDGKLLATFPGSDQQIQLWDPATGKEIER